MRRPAQQGHRAFFRTAVGTLLVAAAITGGVLYSRTSKSKQSEVMTADRVGAQQLAFDISTTANGELEARNKVEIRNPMERESTILELVPEGVRVKKGDVLVKINAEELLTRLEEEQSRVKTALAEKVSAENEYEIQVNENLSQLRQAELDHEVAILSLAQWQRGDDLSKRQEMDLLFQRATVELERVADRYLKSQELCDKDFVSRDERDQDEVMYIAAISEFQKAMLARKTYLHYESPKEEMTKRSVVEKAQAELKRVDLNNQIELQGKASKRDIANDQFAAAERRLERLQDQFDSATITAPQDGLVVYGTSVDRNRWGESDGPLQIGQRVSPNQLLFILPDTSKMIASIRVHESLAGRIRPQMEVQVKVDAAGGKVFPGTVESIGVMAETGGWRDPNLREYTVRVAIDVGEEQLKPSMRCEARVIIDSVPETLTVPVQAVFTDGPVRFVYQARDKRFHRVPVKLGRRSDTVAEILAGLKEGEPVLLREPTAGEIITEPWSAPQLQLAGYQLGPNGEPLGAAGSEGGPRRPAGGQRSKRPVGGLNSAPVEGKDARPQGASAATTATGPAPSGSAPSGSAPSGSAPSGSAPSGSAPSGSAVPVPAATSTTPTAETKR